MKNPYKGKRATDLLSEKLIDFINEMNEIYMENTLGKLSDIMCEIDIMEGPQDEIDAKEKELDDLREEMNKMTGQAIYKVLKKWDYVE